MENYYPQSMNAYPRQDPTLEIHAVRYYYCTVPHAPRKLLPSWVILDAECIWGEHHHKQMIYSQTPPAKGWMGYSQLNSTHDCTLHMTVRTRECAIRHNRNM
eukprot:COSAG01_NODE_9522_length_2421_cov_7.783376_3_plen_101_part_01